MSARFYYGQKDYIVQLNLLDDIANGSASTAAFNAFDVRYLGSKTADPTLDNSGNALIQGAMYWNTVSSVLKVYSGTGWSQVGGATAASIGLGNVNNTSDAAKPVSTAQQTALDLKANLASPTFTGVVTAGSFAGNMSWANITNRPTTLAGYGITDGGSVSSIAWSAVTGTPTTLAGYGVTAVPWTTLTGKPTTLSGYGITDAMAAGSNAASATKLQTARMINGVPFDGTADITVTAGSGTFEPIIAAGTTAQYWRGDKTWQSLASAVGTMAAASAGTATTASSVAWTGITGKPTTLAGYGISVVDATTLGGLSLGSGSLGSAWAFIPRVGVDGVMEVGRYIDFHGTSADGADYSVRMDGGATAGQIKIAGYRIIVEDATNYNISIQGIAAKLKTTGSANGTTFRWEGQGGQPTWLWGAFGGDPDNAYVWNPSNFSVDNAQKLGTIGYQRTMQKRRTRIMASDGTSLDSSITAPEMGFTYGGSGEPVGPFMAFGGLNSDIDYSCQIVAGYNDGNSFYFRSRQGDNNTWNPWRSVFHTGNLVGPAVAATGSTLVQRDGSGHINFNYGFGAYVNTNDEGVGGSAGTVTSIITKRGDNYHRSTTAGSVKTFLGYRGNEIYTAWTDVTADLGVAQCLRWKNYGSNHVIFDASQSTTPAGTACNNTQPDNDWSASYPTLMGYNGNNTYGVRVARAYRAEGLTVGAIGNVGFNGVGYGSYGSVNIAGQTNGYGGFSFSDFNITQMVNRTYQGYYIDNGSWVWGFSNGVLTWGTVPGTSVTGQLSSSTRGSIHEWTGTQRFVSNKGAGSSVGGTNEHPNQVYANDGGCAAMTFHRAGSYAVNLGLDGSRMSIGGYSAGDAMWTLEATNGNMSCKGDITAYSDERLKTNWQDVGPCFVARWAGVKSGTYQRIDSGETQAGLSAQSVQAILPAAVAEQDDGFLSLNYGAAAAVATVELAKELEALKATVKQQAALIKLLMEKAGY